MPFLARRSLFSLLFLLLAAAPNVSTAQWAPGVRVSVTQGEFAMTDLETAAEYRSDELRRQYQVETALVDRFPSRPSLRADVFLPVTDTWRGGLSLGQSSTGGRIAYSDVTGSLTSDIVVRRWYFGGFVERKAVRPTSWLSIWTGLHLRFMGSSLDETTELVIEMPEVVADRDRSASGIGVMPEIAVELEWAGVLLRPHVGYEYVSSTRTDALAQSDPDAPLLTSMSWSGGRVGVALGYSF